MVHDTFLASPATLKDVAAKAGVSHSTVCYALGRSRSALRISDSTIRRVRQIAEEMNYTPNAAASALRRRATGNIGLLMTDELTPGISSGMLIGQRINLLEAACANRDYSLLLIRFNPAKPHTAIEKIASRTVDGLLVTGLEDLRVFEACERIGIPYVDVVGTGGGDEPVCSVEADLIPARIEALKHAARLGHRRAAVAVVHRVRQRRLFAELLARVKTEPELAGLRLTAIDVDTTVESPNAKPVIEAWLAMPVQERPTLLMAYEDMIVGCLREIQSRGLNCPRDVSLISLGKFGLSDTTTPRITGIVNAVERASELSADVLVKAIAAGRRLAREDSPPKLACEFVVAESCAPPPAY